MCLCAASIEAGANLGVILQELSILVFEMGSSTGLRLPDVVRLASQQASGVLVSLLPSAGINYKYVLPCLAFHIDSGINLMLAYQVLYPIPYHIHDMKLWGIHDLTYTTLRTVSTTNKPSAQDCSDFTISFVACKT